MTGVSLALKTFTEGVDGGRKQIEALLNLGVPPREILHPFLSTALETALLPTINSMLGLGIIFLPGMMTGQILSGTLPTTAIMYQIAVIIANCTSVCLTTFFLPQSRVPHHVQWPKPVYRIPQRTINKKSRKSGFFIYEKNRLRSPWSIHPCRAWSFAISWTTSWMAS